MNNSPPKIIEILIARLFCSPLAFPGTVSALDSTVGSMYTTYPILEDFIEHIARGNPPDFVPGQDISRAYRTRSRVVLRFALPEYLRGFTRDLMPNFDALESERDLLYPLRATEFDKHGRARASFLCTSTPARVYRRLTSAAEVIRDDGHGSLRDMVSANRHQVMQWLRIVRGLDILTKTVSSEEMTALEECLGSGDWQRGLTLRIDTSQWVDR